ncbi:hypothetical protein A1O3_00289 [Capronia epimyces CBS 606.96]|uniref:DUF1996 domain-containing protein n=1 Tax=Capronia epimyces CBS 606.96 TaxID=1182542 RepID=W9ZB26_9EURO|nr:uncharacterized protein A1O3_00289 [Capronia epimyces CBS 606.96]EXJ91739.1 hypothetical protein A1O3_00289 [Capronia epimyces CBS 606.96]
MVIPKVKLKSLGAGPALLLVVFLLNTVPVHAFFRHLCFGELGNGRVDPIMSPGHPSQHVHVSFGASSFGFDPTIDELLTSNCTSCSITQDHSVYWAPRMYFQHSNGTFEMIPTSGGMTVYYFTESGEANVSATAFPQNFRMIAGNSVKRAFYGPDPDPPMSLWQPSDMTQQSLMEKALGFNCLHYSDGVPNEGSLEHHGLRNKGFIDSTCEDGIRAELLFPSCWNGKDLDSSNHTTHVAYPSEVKYGTCPEGFPVKLPILFYETIYQTPLFAGMDGQFVFSNGDPTGYGYHGDFICGWDEGVLQDAIDNTICTSLNSTGLQEDCPIFSLQDRTVGTQCKMEVPEALQDEPVNLVQQLPGNIQVQAGPEPATMPEATAVSATPSPTANATVLSVSQNPTSSLAAATAIATAAPLSANMNVTTTPSPSDTDPQITVTSTYMSGSVEVHMILVEDIVTVTVSEGTAPIARAHKRRIHKHGHGNGLVRY